MPELNLFSSRQIRRLLIPLIFEQFMIVLVGLMDTMLLSHVSESALSAFSLVDNLNLLLMQVFMAVGAGGSIIAAATSHEAMIAYCGDVEVCIR